MSKRQFLMLIGVWVAVFLFLGFPLLWHKIIAVVSGLVIIMMAYRLPSTMQKDTSPLEINVQHTLAENTGENNQPNQ